MIYYTEHAKDRMRQRGITEEEVEYGLQNYHTCYRDETGNPIYNNQGIPIYHFKFGIQTQVIPKNRTIYITRPPKPRKTPPTGMTV